MGYGLWGDSKNISRVFGHGGIGGSEGLCDREKRLTTGFTCNFGKDVRKVRDLLYKAVGMCWRYGNDKGADIQEIQMRRDGGEMRICAGTVLAAAMLAAGFGCERRGCARCVLR